MVLASANDFLLDALGGLIVAGLGMLATSRNSEVPARRAALFLTAACRYVIAGYRYALPARAAALAASPGGPPATARIRHSRALRYGLRTPHRLHPSGEGDGPLREAGNGPATREPP